jgi:hypothetical protein
MKSVRKLSLLLVPLVMLLTVASLYPQAGANGAISGFVTDPSGAAVAGVTVKATNVSTGVSYTAGTTTDGYYSVKFLVPGPYRVEVAQPGFKTQVVNNVVVQTASNPTVNITLTLGAVAQTVTVTDKTSQIEAQTADGGAVIDTKRVDDVPTQQRNAFGLVYVAPSVIPTSTEKSFTLEDVSKSSSQSVNGGQVGIASFTATNDILVDGVEDRMSYSTAPSSNVGYIPSQEAVGELKVVNNPFSAEYGRTNGGTYQFSTKSGTNHYHGQLFEYNRSFGLSSTIFDTNRAHQGKAPLLFNTPGGQVGGPLYKQKLFGFFSYEYMDEHAPTLEFGTVPTQAMRQGDFSSVMYNNSGTASPITLYNPFSCTSSTTTCTARTVIPNNNLVAAGLMDPSGIATNLWKYIPLPDATGNPITGAQNYYPSGGLTQVQHTYEMVSRVDYNINETNRMTFRAIRENWVSTGTDFYIVGGDAAEVAGPSGRANHNDLIDYTHTFSPTSVLDVRLGMERFLGSNPSDSLGCKVTPGQLGFGSVFQSQAAACMPIFGFSNASGGGSYLGAGTTFAGAGEGGNSWAPDQINTLSGTFLKAMGRHTLKFGGYGFMERGYYAAEGAHAGSFSFSSQYDQLNPAGALSASQGDPVAAFEMGVGSASIYVNSEEARQSLSAAWFVQDDIKVSRKLTINAGLRWDWNGGPTDRFNAMLGPFNQAVASPIASAVSAAAASSSVTCPACPNLAGGMTFVGVNGVSRSPYDSTFNNFGPRLGAAYALSPNTVIRAGWGLFYLPYAFDPGNSGFSSTTNGVLFSSTYQVLNLISNPFPTGLTPPTGSSLGLSTFLGSSVTFVDPHAREPRSQQFNFNIQHQLPGGFLVTAGYNYNGVARVPVNVNLDYLTLAQIQQGYTYLNTSVTNPFYNVGCSTTTLCTTSLGKNKTVAQSTLLLPYPQFSGVTENDVPIGNSAYHGFGLQVNKRWSNGLSFSAAYTNSRHEVRDSYQNPFDAAYMNTSNPHLMKQYDEYDIPQFLNFYWTYDLPVGRGKSYLSQIPGWANQIIGGWEFTGIARFQDGMPWQFPLSGSNGSVPVPGQDPYNSPKTVDQWLNPAAFVNVTGTGFCYDPGQTTPRGNCIQEWSTWDGHVRTPGVHNLDFGITKTFQITERIKFVFINNWVNSLNTPQFDTTPGSSCYNRSSSAFGQIAGCVAQTNPARQIQMAGRIIF